MATVFWDSDGISMIDYKERSTTINGTYYAMLKRKLRDEIKKKRRGKLSRSVLLLQDNAPVHIAVVAKTAIKACNFTELSHPPYNPDLVSSYYYLFSKMKLDLRGQKFSNGNEVIAAAEQHFSDIDKSFFLKGIEMLVSRFQRCFEVKGNYIEK